MIQPNLAIRRTFPQVKPALRAAVGGGKVRRGGATFRFRGVALPSVLGGSVWALGWLYFAVQLVLMGRYLHKDLMNEKSNLQQQLSQIADTKQKRENAQSRLDDIYTILDGLKNHPMQYDDRIVRQIIECVVVESKEEIKVIFIGGLETTEKLGE